MVTPSLVVAIVEIVYNLMKIASSSKDKELIKKRKALLKKLASKKTKVAAKKSLVVKHRVNY